MAMNEINIKDYSYELPSDRIAKHPLPERDQSKLLVYKKGKISHSIFNEIDTLLPSNSCLYFNNTRVIPARLIFKKESGTEIEIFILHPLYPSAVVADAMQATQTSTWKCTIGNLKRWPDELILTLPFLNGKLSAQLLNRADTIVIFSWTPTTLTFAEVIKETGSTPLPPYLKRKAEKEDSTRYQTIYSKADGAVAAPTAGLHFTDTVLNSLHHKGIRSQFLTLHVSAGTFLPVKVENAVNHPMHAEQIMIKRETVESLLNEDQTIVAVGTTSMRTLESLYWYGVKLLLDASSNFIIGKMDAYTLPNSFTKRQSLETILTKMKNEKAMFITGETSIYIMPGYSFKIGEGLITNFHQPSSTLMLLVASFIGDDWRKVYQQALENGYRFLSYGDSSLLLPHD